MNSNDDICLIFKYNGTALLANDACPEPDNKGQNPKDCDFVKNTVKIEDNSE